VSTVIGVRVARHQVISVATALASASRRTRSSPGCDTSAAIDIGVRVVRHRIAGPIHNDFSAFIAESLYCSSSR